MKMKAKIVCTYESGSTSKAIAAALRPDNIQVPRGIRVVTLARGGQVITEVEMDGRIETFLATLEDLLSCTSTAESVL